MERLHLNRRRLEEAFLLFATLEVVRNYNLWESIESYPGDRNSLVEMIADEFSKAFINKWGGKLPSELKMF